MGLFESIAVVRMLIESNGLQTERIVAGNSLRSYLDSNVRRTKDFTAKHAKIAKRLRETAAKKRKKRKNLTANLCAFCASSCLGTTKRRRMRQRELSFDSARNLDDSNANAGKWKLRTMVFTQFGLAASCVRTDVMRQRRNEA